MPRQARRKPQKDRPPARGPPGRIDQLERQRAEVKRRWLDDLAGGNTRIDFLAEALETIDGETSSLTKRADFLERLAAETRKARIPQDGLASSRR